MTLAGIAEDVGVSITTASKVLNGAADVAPGTRARVERALQTSGYVRGPRTRGADVVEVVRGAVRDASAVEVIDGIQRALSAAACTTILVSGPGADGDVRWLRGCLRRAPVAVIVFGDPGTRAQAVLRARGIRLVIVTLNAGVGRGPTADAVARVGAAEAAGGFLAIDHLRTLGHVRIGLVADLAQSVRVGLRLAGCTVAADQRSATPVELIEGWAGAAAAPDPHEQAARLLRDGSPPTAIVSLTDAAVLDVLRALRERPPGVTGAVSVIGFDDAVAARSLGRVTTVAMPARRVGAEAVRLALAPFTEGARATTAVAVAPELVVRSG
nr:LacI family DNA-binding transcriptional regulator [Microbacterium sp. Marseille-Q6648]